MRSLGDIRSSGKGCLRDLRTTFADRYVLLQNFNICTHRNGHVGRYLQP